MYGVYKLTQLEVNSDHTLWVTLEKDNHAQTLKVPTSALCTGFANALTKAGIYNPEGKTLAETFNKEAAWPPSLLNIDVEVNLNSMDGSNSIAAIELTPSSSLQADRTLNTTQFLDRAEFSSIIYKESIGAKNKEIEEKPRVEGICTYVHKGGSSIKVKVTDTYDIKIDKDEIEVKMLGTSTPTYSKKDDSIITNAWEINHKMPAEEVRKISQEAYTVSNSFLKDQKVVVFLDTYDLGYGPGIDKYGRYLGVVYTLDSVDKKYINLNKTLLARGLAEPFVMLDSYGKVQSDFPVNLWQYISPYSTHTKTEDERIANMQMADAKMENAYRDLMNTLDTPSQTRRVDTLKNYIPRYGETPQELIDRYGCSKEEFLDWNDLPESIFDLTVEELEESGFYSRPIDLPVYDSVDDFYGVEIIPEDELDPSISFDRPEHIPDFNPVLNPEIVDRIQLPPLTSPYHLRIGDIEFVVPPLAINLVTSAHNIGFKPLRGKGSIQTQSGYINRVLEIELFFHEVDAINGYAIENPDPLGADDYYIDGLRPLIALFKKAPFVPIENELINETYGIFSVALGSIKISTIPDFPNTVSAVLQLMPFNHIPYMPQYETMEEAYNWPLFRWYYQQAMQPKDSRTHLAPVDGVTQDIVFYIADEAALVERMEAVKRFAKMPTPHQYEKENKPSSGSLQGKELHDAAQIELGMLQKRRYDDFLKIKSDATPKEICRQIYKKNEDRVFIFPGYTTQIDGINRYDFDLIQELVMDPNVAYYVPRIKAKTTKQALEKLESKTKKYLFTGNLYRKYAVITTDDSVAISTVQGSGTGALQDIEDYKRRYDQLYSLAHGPESNIPLNPVELEDLIITQLEATYENSFVPIQISEEQEPSLQHLGGGEAYFSVRAQTTNRNTIEKLRFLFNTSQRYTREYRIAIVSGFLGFDSSLSKLLGVDSVLFDTFNVSTIDSMPGLFDLEFTLIGFDKEQKTSEMIDKIEGIDVEQINDKFDLPTPKPNNLGYENVILESRLKQMELYPDLELPTYAEVNRVLPYLDCGINAIPNHHRARFVDPDFYISYTESYRNDVIEYLNNLDSSSESVEFNDTAGFNASLKLPTTSNPAPEIQLDEKTFEFVEEHYDELVFEPEGAQNITTIPSEPKPTIESAESKPINVEQKVVSRKSTPIKHSPSVDKIQAIINLFEPHLDHIRANRLFPSVLIAMAIDATSNGTVCYNYNLYNLKPSDAYKQYWDGSVHSPNEGGGYRSYKSYGQCIYNIVEYLSQDPMKRPILNAQTPAQAADALYQCSFYTGSGAYSKVGKIKSLIERHSLETYDKARATSSEDKSKSKIQYDKLNTSSAEWGTSVAKGICFTQFESDVINLTGVSNIVDLNAVIELGDYRTKYKNVAKLLKSRGLKKKADLGKNQCLELYAVEGRNEDRVVKARVANKSSFEGKYWAHYKEGEKASKDKNVATDAYVASQKDTYKGMFYDMVEYDKRGRLLRAFPSFQMLLIDEGRWLSWYRMWDTFYGFNSILSIDIMKSRKMAADTLLMNMSNVYGQISQKDYDGHTRDTWKWYDMFNLFDPEAATEAWRTLTETPTVSIIEAQKERINTLALKPGARVHLRMGYGANAYSLPIVFNGVITECDVQEDVTVIAQGDGIELSHKIPNQKPDSTNDPGVFRGLKEPRDLICTLLTEYGGAWKTFATSVSKGYGHNPNDILTTVAHFGQSGWLPPATHKIAQKLGRGLHKLWNYGPGRFLSPKYSARRREALEAIEEEKDLIESVFGKNADNYGEPGLNVYRSAGLETFSETHYTTNTVDADGNPVSAGEKIGVKGRNFATKAMYWAVDKLALGSRLFDWASKGDEANIEVWLYDRSIWDVMVTLSRTVQDYMVGVVPFELRSTVFFGRPTWGLAYKYEYKYVYDEEAQAIRSVVVGVPRKPYLQMHTYHSFLDIVQNKIRASSDNIYTNVITTWSTKGAEAEAEKQSAVAHADTNIYPEFQTTAIVNIDIVKDKRTSPEDKVKSAENSAVSLLKDFMKDMYDGELLVMGDPSIKPHDVFYIDDNYIDMKGFMGTKQIIHHFSYETGFVTSVKPDLLVEGQRRELVTYTMWGLPLVTYTAGAWFGRKMISTAWRSVLGMPASMLLKKGQGFLTFKIAEGLLGISSVDAVPEAADTLSRLYQAYKDLDGTQVLNILDSAEDVANLSKIGSFADAKDSLIKLGKFTQNPAGYNPTTAKIATFGAAFMPGGKYYVFVKIALNIVSTIAMYNIVESISQSRRLRQSVMIIPVTYQGQPFVAGINGSRGMIAGSDPGAMDKFLNSKPMQIVDALFGIETPNYDNSDFKMILE